MLASIAMLMLALTLWSGVQTSAASAAEVRICATTVDDSAVGHAPGDGDEVPADDDNAAPHHHGVSHSHELGIPAREWAGALLVGDSLPRMLASGTPPAAFAPARDLRPPIA